jgi:putative spermidine/putrescine transport system substrate-binding protein
MRLKTTVRSGLVGTMSILTAVALVGCSASGGGSTDSDTTLTVLDYGGPYQEAHENTYFKQCADELGVTIQTDEPVDYSKIRTAVESGNVPWDVINTASDFGPDSSGGDYLEPIDYDIVDKTQLLDGYAGTYRVGSDIEATLVAYNEDALNGAPAPTSLADFFDTSKIPGKRGLYKSVSSGVLELALLADGVAPDDLYPLDVDRALKKLDTIKSDIVWWETGASSQAMLTSGETPLSFVWVGRALDSAETDGAPVKVVYDQWVQTDDYWSIPKGAKNPELSNKLIQCMSTKDAQVAWAQESHYGPVNAEAATDPSVANENRPTNHLTGQVKVDDDWWAENYDMVAEKFNTWMAE